MPKYFREVNKHFSGDKTTAARYMGVARSLLGGLVEMSGGLFQNARKVVMPDGTKITVWFAGAVANISVDAAQDLAKRLVDKLRVVIVRSYVAPQRYKWGMFSREAADQWRVDAGGVNAVMYGALDWVGADGTRIYSNFFRDSDRWATTVYRQLYQGFLKHTFFVGQTEIACPFTTLGATKYDGNIFSVSFVPSTNGAPPNAFYYYFAIHRILSGGARELVYQTPVALYTFSFIEILTGNTIIANALNAVDSFVKFNATGNVGILRWSKSSYAAQQVMTFRIFGTESGGYTGSIDISAAPLIESTYPFASDFITGTDTAVHLVRVYDDVYLGETSPDVYSTHRTIHQYSTDGVFSYTESYTWHFNDNTNVTTYEGLKDGLQMYEYDIRNGVYAYATFDGTSVDNVFQCGATKFHVPDEFMGVLENYPDAGFGSVLQPFHYFSGGNYANEPRAMALPGQDAALFFTKGSVDETRKSRIFLVTKEGHVADVTDYLCGGGSSDPRRWVSFGITEINDTRQTQE